MEGVLPWLFHWAPCAGTKDFCSTLAALVCPVPYIFPLRTLFHFVFPGTGDKWRCMQADVFATVSMPVSLLPQSKELVRGPLS
jgi:hypothetical protein